MEVKINPDNIEAWEVFKGVSTQLMVNGCKMTALKSTWAPGACSIPHRHPHEQILFCQEGKMVFLIEGNEYHVEAGEFVYIAPNAPHHQINKSDRPAIFVECFSPVRDDLLNHKFMPS